MKNFIPTILALLGIKAFTVQDNAKVLTAEEQETLRKNGFDDEFLTKFMAAVNAPDEPDDHARQLEAMRATLSRNMRDLIAAQERLEQLQADAQASAGVLAAKETEIANLKQQVLTLAASAEPDAPQTINSTAGNNGINLADDKQLGGRMGEMFALNRPYNQRARAALLARQGQSIAVSMTSSMDYSSLKEDLGAFYRQSWQDRIQSLLVELPTIAKIFPTESGHQDLDTLVNIWFGEFSQPDNIKGSDFDNVRKGSYEFGTETLRMYSVMFVHKFYDLVELEKTWIGSLNREGSGVIKWSFIEFILAETARKLHNERELRYVNGVRRNPNPNVPGSALDAADGIYEYLRKRIEGYIDFTVDGGTTGQIVYQIKPTKIGEITAANIGEKYFNFVSSIPAAIRDTGSLVLYIPSWQLPLYHKYCETLYGTNRDYKAGEMYVHEYPQVAIKVINNADNHNRIFATVDGNIKTYEQKPGEMTRFEIEQQDWTLKVWSRWKESVQAVAVGKKYTDPADMDGTTQIIWASETDLAADYFVDSTPDMLPNGSGHTSILLVPNTSVLNITDIPGAKVGVAITLKAGASDTNGAKIEKSGKFALISAAWNPAKGDTITVMKRADGKFIEISRNSAPADSSVFEANATTPSLAGGTVFVTNANTDATAITNFTGAEVGVVYTIHGAGSTNASTIANSGNFVLTDAMKLSEGAYIKLVKDGAGKFNEIARG